MILALHIRMEVFLKSISIWSHAHSILPFLTHSSQLATKTYIYIKTSTANLTIKGVAKKIPKLCINRPLLFNHILLKNLNYS